MKTAIVYVTHKLTAEIHEEILKLYDETKNFATLYIVYQADLLNISDYTLDHIPHFSFSIGQLNQLGYRTFGSKLMDGNFHLVLLYFFLHHSQFDYYWLVEYDVRFTGNWATFFTTFENKQVDFVSAHVETWNQNPNWLWWHSIHLSNLKLTKNQVLKSFNPICRFSNRALRLLNERCRMGDLGHNEVLMATLFRYYKLSILDFGGHGSYTDEQTRDLFYIDDIKDSENNMGTHRFRPEFKLSEITLANKIYHPIK